MKKISVFILLAFIIFPFVLNAQVLSDQQKSYYQNKVISFKKMKRTGIGLTIGGSVLSVAGMVMMINSGSDYVNNDYYSSTDDLPAEFYLGEYVFIGGVAAIAGGITLWSMGGSRARKYSKKLNSLSLNLNPAPHQTISLAYRF